MPNPTAAELRKLAEEALGRSADREDLLTFLQQHVRPRPKQRWTLEGHEYLGAIARDESRHIVIEKAAQVGASTLAIGRLIHSALQGYHVGYFLDTRDRMRTFVQNVMDPIINNSGEITRLVAEEEWRPPNIPRRRGGHSPDNVRLKRIGPGRAIFLSTQVMGEVKTTPLDMIMMDEVAELNPDIVEFAQDRLLHSDYRRQWWYSQPGVPEMDIDERFRASDMKYWKIRCRRCRAWTALELSFPDCLIQVRGDWRIACPSCHAKLHRADGEWVAMHADRDVSGYHISQLYGPHVDAQIIAEQWEHAQTRPNRMERFHISILGLPFAGDRKPLTDVVLNERCGTWGISPIGKGADLPLGIPFAGIDVGDVLHLVVARYAQGIGRIVWIEETPDWDLVQKRLRDHNVAGFVIDAKPEKTKAKELVRALGNGAIIYTSAQQMSIGEEDSDTKPVRKVSMNRTDLLDEMVAAFTSGELYLPKPGLPETQRVREHLGRVVKDRKSDGSFEYRKNVENHFGFALAHMLVGANAQEALKLAPAGHFEAAMRHEESRHIVGQTYSPRSW